MTPDSDSDTAAVLDVTSDFATATYTPDGGEAVALVNNKDAGPAVSYTLTGTIAIPGQMEQRLTLSESSTMTEQLLWLHPHSGTDMDIDAGTYTVDDSYVYTFEFDKAGELTSHSVIQVQNLSMYRLVMRSSVISTKYLTTGLPE